MSTRLFCKRAFSLTTGRLVDFSHVVIGGGVVGTAIADQLQKIPANSVALLEQHEMLGMETTSRNSEVVHAGLYYPPDSLKARLCIRGKELIYGLDPHIVSYKQCAKLVVAQSEANVESLEKLLKNARTLGVPAHMVSRSSISAKYPLLRAEYGALESPSTGIMSAHELVTYCRAGFENAGGTLGLQTKVIGLEYEREMRRYVIHCMEMGSKDEFTLTAENVANSAGLHAPKIANMLLPEERRVSSHFAKGNYFSFAPVTPIPTSKITSKLIYPCPEPNAVGLGTHLTFNLGGQIQFGPDVEWLTDNDAEALKYNVSSENLVAAHKAVQKYFPGVKFEELQPSYSGIRPKLLSKSDSLRMFADFYIEEEAGFPGFVNLLGIESPGLTSALAIGEHVKNMYHA